MKSLSKIKKIYGPPGTGKTTYLLKIVEEEIARKVLPNEIAFLAYTKKAATEAINRASQKFKLDTKEFKHFRTIHSLAFQSLGLSTNDVMKPKHYIEVSEALKVDLQPKDIHDDDGNFIQQDPYLKIIDLSRITGIDLHDTFSKYGHIVGGWRKLEQIAEYLKEYKKVRNLYDFTDMLIEFNLRPEVWPHLEVLIVDEAQDL
jgi:superfamily I DNA/RNA helicase